MKVRMGMHFYYPHFPRVSFPLVELMWIRLQIICPDRPYVRALCGDQSIYFNPEILNSLHGAVVELSHRLNSGWWTEWSENIKAIPRDWEEVAAAISGLATGEGDTL
jgi:hypothetical protein